MEVALYTKNNLFGAYAGWLVSHIFADDELTINDSAYSIYQALKDVTDREVSADLYIFAGVEGEYSDADLRKFLPAIMSHVDNPFTQVIYVAEHGNGVTGFNCKVTDEHCFLYTLLQELQGLDFGKVSDRVKNNQGVFGVVDALEVYYKYDVSSPLFDKALDLQELWLSYRGGLHGMVVEDSLEDIQDRYSDYFILRAEYREGYVKSTSKKAKYAYIESKSLTLISLYCENYRNEVAKYLLDNSRTKFAVVLFISPTQYHDMLVVRSKNVPADKFCYYLSNGKGKGNAHAGYFYLQTSWGRTLVDSYVKYITQG